MSPDEPGQTSGAITLVSAGARLGLPATVDADGLPVTASSPSAPLPSAPLPSLAGADAQAAALAALPHDDWTKVGDPGRPLVAASTKKLTKVIGVVLVALLFAPLLYGLLSAMSNLVAAPPLSP